jgi:uncharacterized membrane protein YbhN (UPF0104 family)
VSIVFLQKALNTPLNNPQLFLSAALVYTGTILPIHAPLCIGTGEAVWIVVFNLMGIRLEEAIIISVGVRMFELLITLSDGLIGSTIMFFNRNK